MLYDILVVVAHMLAGIAAIALLAFGFAFLIFLGAANAEAKSLVSPRFDKFAMVVIYLSWFGPLWWFGFSASLLMVACAATAILCLIFTASYRAAASRRHPTPLGA